MNNNIEESLNIFRDINYSHYIVQYQGDIEYEISKKSGYYVTLINDKFAIVSMPLSSKLFVGEKDLKSIVYIKSPERYTLQQMSPIESAQIRPLQLELPLNLTGKDVIVAMLDTGIDYLNEEFMDSHGNTRIECIWDQNILSQSNGINNEVTFGQVYSKEKIQEAITAFRNGQSPYDIVPTIDEIGHGTSMAGIIGASGKNPELKGVASDCSLISIKLIEDYEYKNKYNIKIPIFNITAIFSALEFLYRYALKNNKPMVIYFPLGTNSGNHKGNGILEEYIESISAHSGIVIVTGTGNEREKRRHASGVIDKEGGMSLIDLEISPEQKHLWVEIWADAPNIFSIDILSPSGENTGIIEAAINSTDFHTFIFEETSIIVKTYLPEENTGDELICINFYNLQPGIWKLRIIGNMILDGKFNVWIPQEGISLGDTHLSPSDPYGTLMNPSSSDYIVAVAAYNQNNNNVLAYSGMAFVDNYKNIIDVAAGGVNTLAVAPNNKTSIVNGTSVAAAIVSGVCAMLFEWGIINKNDPYIYSQSIKTYLSRGTNKRIGDIYPNPQWGYGMINVLKMFENMT